MHGDVSQYAVFILFFQKKSFKKLYFLKFGVQVGKVITWSVLNVSGKKQSSWKSQGTMGIKRAIEQYGERAPRDMSPVVYLGDMNDNLSLFTILAMISLKFARFG